MNSAPNPTVENARPDGPQLLVLAASSRAELLQQMAELGERLENASAKESVAQIAQSLNVPLPRGDFRLSLVAANAEELRKRMRFAADRLADPARQSIHSAQGVYYAEPESRIVGQIAFMFPGEGSQYPGMLGDLSSAFPEVQNVVHQMDAVYADGTKGIPLSSLLFPANPLDTEQKRAAETRLWEMEYAVPAVLAADLALYQVLTRLGLHPDVVLGHSTGEFAALMVSGAINLEQSGWSAFAGEFAAIPERVGANAVPPSTLFAVAAPAETVFEQLGDLDGAVYLGMDNCPHQAVVVVEEPLVAPVLERLRARGLIFERLRFDRPYHTPLFGAYAPHLASLFEQWISLPPQMPTYTCTSAAAFPGDIIRVRELAVQHWIQPVRFRETVERMYADGVRIFVEVGAKGNLTGFVGDTLRGRPHLALPADVTHRPGRLQLCHLLGILAAHQVPLALDHLYESLRAAGSTEEAPVVTTDVNAVTPSLVPQEFPDMNLSPNRMPHAEVSAAQSPSPAPARAESEVAVLPALNAHHTNGAARSPAADPVAHVMAAHLKLMSQFLAVQQDVMHRFLAGASEPGLQANGLPIADEAEFAFGSLQAPADPLPIPEPEPHVAVRPVGDAGAPVKESAPVAMATTENGSGSGVPSGEVLTQALLNLVSERTGYPVEMLDLNLDMEADLGIDSIKRVEILSSFQQQARLPSGTDMEAFASRKTLREVIELVNAYQTKPSA